MFQTGSNNIPVFKRISPSDYLINEFTVEKTWEAWDYYNTVTGSVYRMLHTPDWMYFGGSATYSSSKYTNPFPTQSIDPTTIFYWAYHQWYKDMHSSEIISDTWRILANRFLWESASMFSIPQNRFGEGIAEGSLSGHDYSAYDTSSLKINFEDDRLGNLLDSDINTGSIIPSCALYYGFNEKYNELNRNVSKLPRILDSSGFDNHGKLINPAGMKWVNGIPTTGFYTGSSGIAAQFSSSVILVKNNESLNPRTNEDFAISFFLKMGGPASLPTSSDYTYILTKYGIEDHLFQDKLQGTYSYYQAKNFPIGKPQNTKYPYGIFYDKSSKKLIFEQSSGVTTLAVSSSAVSGSSWYHVLCQKSGSIFGIWLNGTLQQSCSYSMTGSVRNDSDILIGGNPALKFQELTEWAQTTLVSGSIDEFRIYRKGLSETEISYLSNNDYWTGSAYQTNRMGNVFYGVGKIIVSDPRPKYKNVFLGKTGNMDHSGSYGWYLNYKSKITLYEHEIVCKVKETEFNFTTNPSIKRDGDVQTTYMADMFTGSYWTPYVTTIGLYDDNYQLLAVAKLSSPIPKMSGVDINFILKFDF